MEFREWWDTFGSGIRPAISSDMEAHAHFVANAAWNAAQQNTNVAEQTPTNTGSPKLPEWEAVEKECGPYRTNGDRWHAGYAEGVKRCFRVIVRQLRAGA